MINVVKKISIIVILMLLIAIVFSGNSQATIGNIFKDADEFLEEGDPVGETINETQLQETSKFLYKLLLAIGIVVMFIVGTILGIQFMIASAEDKAKVKEALVPYIVGCLVIFGAFTIWELAVNLGQEFTDENLTLLGDRKKETAIVTMYNNTGRKISSNTYYNVDGLKQILNTYFKVGTYTGGAPYTRYSLKDTYMNQILEGKISICYEDYYNSTRYLNIYECSLEDLPQRVFQIAPELFSSN